MEPSYHKQKVREFNDREASTSRRIEKEVYYETPSRSDPRYLCGRPDKEVYIPSGSRRDREPVYGPRIDTGRRSPSAESIQSFGSAETDSPNFSPVPPAMHQHADREGEYYKHRESSGDRYPVSVPPHMTFNPPMQPPRDYCPPEQYSHRDYNMEYSYPVKSSSKSRTKTYGPYPPGPESCYGTVQYAQRTPYVELQPCATDSDPRNSRVPDPYVHSGRYESMGDRDKQMTAGRKKYSSREPGIPPLVHYTQSNPYVPPVPDERTHSTKAPDESFR